MRRSGTTRRLRTVAVLAAVVAATALLTSCTPAPEPMVGLAVRDGKAIVVVVSCPGYSSRASVYRIDETPAGASSDAYDELTWEVYAKSPAPVAEVAMFEEPPAGWTVKDETLSSLEPGWEYAITGYAHRRAITVTFTVADLRRLGPDDVLVETNGGKRGITPRASFVSWAADSCE